jgi:hypothetical protein
MSVPKELPRQFDAVVYKARRAESWYFRWATRNAGPREHTEEQSKVPSRFDVC